MCGRGPSAVGAVPLPRGSVCGRSASGTASLPAVAVGDCQPLVSASLVRSGVRRPADLRPNLSLVRTRPCTPLGRGRASAIGPLSPISTTSWSSVHNGREAPGSQVSVSQSNRLPSSVPKTTTNASRSSLGRLKATSKGTPFRTRNSASARPECRASFPLMPRLPLVFRRDFCRDNQQS